MIPVDVAWPAENQVVIAYLPDGDFYFARFQKILTWSGRKFKFVNLMSNRSWYDDVVGWNRLPKMEETLK